MRTQHKASAVGTAHLTLEAAGVLTALALALGTFAHIATSPRAWVLFYDGDSLLFPLISASIRVGQPQDWVLSSPLFILESLVYLPIGLVGLPVKVTLLLDACANWVALYLVFRAVIRVISAHRSVCVFGSLLILAVVSCLAALEGSPSHDALELASLLLTTTYYSGTVVTTVAAIALTGQVLTRAPIKKPLVALSVLTAIAVMSNPLFIAWAVVPLFAILILCLLTKVAFRQVSAVAIVLSIGSVLGIIARIPFKAILVQDNAAKIRPDLASQSLAYYSGLLLDRLKTGWGVVALVVILALLALAAIGLATALKRRQTGSTIISGIALLGPLSATVGAVMLGTFAARYLEPVVFLAPLSLVTLPLLLPRASQLTRKRIANNLPRLTGTLALLALVVCIAVLSSIRTIGTPDASLVVSFGSPSGVRRRRVAA